MCRRLSRIGARGRPRVAREAISHSTGNEAATGFQSTVLADSASLPRGAVHKIGAPVADDGLVEVSMSIFARQKRQGPDTTLRMDSNPADWWRDIPKRRMPGSLRVLLFLIGFVGLSMALTGSQDGDTVRFVAGLLVWMLLIPVFFVWHWNVSRAGHGPRV